MKIIKVTHGNSLQELEVERQLFTLQGYQAESFLQRHQDSIIKECQIKELADDIDLLLKASIGGGIVGAIGAAGKHKLDTMSGKRQGESIFTQRPNDSVWIQQRFIKSMKVTAATLLKDVTTQIQMRNSEVVSLETARAQYPGTHNLSIGTYTLHPYDEQRLTRLENYHRNLALEKDDELVTLLGKMGAKTLRIIERDTQQGSGSGRLAVETIVANAKADASLAHRVSKEKELLVIFEGKRIDIDPHPLKNSLWFANDSTLNTIFQSRRDSLNQIQAYTLSNTYTETFDFDFDLATRYIVVKIDLRAQYHSVSQKERFFHVEFGA